MYPKSYKRSLTNLSSALNGAETDVEASAALGAIGNTHDPSFADDVEPFLESENVQTQMAALEALNRINRVQGEAALEALMEMPTARGQIMLPMRCSNG